MASFGHAVSVRVRLTGRVLREFRLIRFGGEIVATDISLFLLLPGPIMMDGHMGNLAPFRPLLFLPLRRTLDERRYGVRS